MTHGRCDCKETCQSRATFWSSKGLSFTINASDDCRSRLPTSTPRCASHSRCSTPTLSHHDIMGLALCIIVDFYSVQSHPIRLCASIFVAEPHIGVMIGCPHTFGHSADHTTKDHTELATFVPYFAARLHGGWKRHHYVFLLPQRIIILISMHVLHGRFPFLSPSCHNSGHLNRSGVQDKLQQHCNYNISYMTSSVISMLRGKDSSQALTCNVKTERCVSDFLRHRVPQPKLC